MNIEEHVSNERLRQVRIEQHLTQAELAEKVGTTFETVSRWERGLKTPGPYFRRRLCEVLGKTAEELGLLPPSESPPPLPSTASIFLSSSYADADHPFVLALKAELQNKGIAVWGSRTIKRQETRNKRHVLQEVIHAVRGVVLIASPGARDSHLVHDTLRLALYYQQPICALWIAGERIQDCLPEEFGEPALVIDARKNPGAGLASEIVATLEQEWFGSGTKEEVNASEPVWNVPVPPTRLLGREQELQSISTMLLHPEIRLLTLLGPGGIGKTHLALQAAVDVRRHFPDGVCFVALAPIQDHALVIPTIAEALDIREMSEQPLFEQLQVALKNKQLLLILDNFEQVHKAAAQLAALLAACPQLKVLVTSRARLHLRAEHDFQVPPLAMPDVQAVVTSEQLLRYSAVAVFVQRAQAIMPDFQLNEANGPRIAEICARLDGLPLALELAAARIRLLEPQALLSRLSHPLQILMSKEQDVEERQRTLRNTIAWSYDLLSPEEQRLFQRLSVFSDGCKLDAIEAIYNALGEESYAVWDMVESLLDKSLLQPTERNGERRLRLLDTIRDYAMEHLVEQGQVDLVKQAHANFYLSLAELAESELRGADQQRWLSTLDQETENIRSALKWLIDHREAEPALRLCAALWWFWRLRGHWSEGLRSLNATFSLSEADAPTLARARALCAAGDLAYCHDNYDVARAWLEEGVKLCRMLRAEQQLARSLCVLGAVAHAQGEHAQAQAWLQESERICRTQGYTWDLAFLLRRLGHLQVYRGELHQALIYNQEGLTLAKKLGDSSLLATIYSTLGDISAHQDDLEQAIVYHQESLRLARQLGDKLLAAIALQNIGYYGVLSGDLLKATYAQEGLILMRELGDRMMISIALHTVGYVMLRQGKLVQAKACFYESQSFAQEIGFEKQKSWNLFGLALVAVEEGQFQHAARLLGAVSARFQLQTDLNGAERAEYRRALEQIRTRLGGKAFIEARDEGKALTPEQLLASSSSVIASPSPPSARYPDNLTEREVEVLCLLVQDLTDDEIAKRLVIAPRTVNSHLTSIYRKIQVSSESGERQGSPRRAAVRYAIEHDLC